jgi:fatty acid desaturase
MPDSSEQERLKRIRDQQIAARNPRSKEENFSRTMQKRDKKLQRKISAASVWNDIPHKVRSTAIALVIGLILFLVVPMYWTWEWAFVIMLGVALIFAIVGFVIGNALDARDRLRDYSKH